MEPPEEEIRRGVEIRYLSELPETLPGDELPSCQIQYEACRAFIESQRSQGWMLIEDRFDDDGFSGSVLWDSGHETRQKPGTDSHLQGRQMVSVPGFCG